MSPCLSLTEMFRMRVVRPAVLQWRHHHRPFLLEIPQDLRGRENGKISLYRDYFQLELNTLISQVIYGRSWQEVATDPRFRVNIL